MICVPFHNRSPAKWYIYLHAVNIPSLAKVRKKASANKTFGGVDVQIHIFITSALDGSE
jgi:hypothetical protein